MYPTADVMEKLGKKEPITISLYDNIANQLAADSKPCLLYTSRCV